MLTITIDSSAFEADLTRALQDCERDGLKNTQDSVKRIGEGTRQRAPVGHEFTGEPHLRDTIQVSLDNSGGEVRVGSRHGPYVEFGTYKDRAQPYLRPAVAAEQSR